MAVGVKTICGAPRAHAYAAGLVPKWVGPGYEARRRLLYCIRVQCGGDVTRTYTYKYVHIMHVHGLSGHTPFKVHAGSCSNNYGLSSHTPFEIHTQGHAVLNEASHCEAQAQIRNCVQSVKPGINYDTFSNLHFMLCSSPGTSV